MEVVENGNLSEIVKEKGNNFNEEYLLDIITMVTIGVVHMHKKGIYHGDIKLENILRDQHGILKLADFGSAI